MWNEVAENSISRPSQNLFSGVLEPSFQADLDQDSMEPMTFRLGLFVESHAMEKT